MDFSEIRKALDEIFAIIEADSGIKMAFDREDKSSHQNSHTFYIRYQGPYCLPRVTSKVDITIKEEICFPLRAMPIMQVLQTV